jgi:hypothetical protein
VPNADPARQPPEILYRYTTSSGLVGILQNSCLWGTDLGFMNDTSELNYGLRMAVDLTTRAAADWSRAHGADFERDLALELANTFDLSAGKFSEGWLGPISEISNEFFIEVSCFCENGDSLGQWRGYGTPGGYAIGFKSSELESLVAEKHLPLRSVVYVPEKQRRAMREAIQSYLAPLKPSGDARSTARNIANGVLWADILGIAAQIKDPAFEQEKEWRIAQIVITDYVDDHNRLLFRDSPQGVLPYVNFNLADASGRLPLASVIVGPGGNIDQRIRAVTGMLATLRYDMSTIKVIPSRVPFRD